MRYRTMGLIAALALAVGCDGGGVTSCVSSRECTSSGRVCDVTIGVCVECLTNVDCLEADQVCLRQECTTVTPCVSSRQCPGLVCDTDRGFCVECLDAVDCTGEQTCDAEGFCRDPLPRCASDRECSELGRVCDTTAGECVECVRQPDCVEGFVCSERRCVRDFDAGDRTDAGPSPLDSGPPPLDAGPDAGPATDAGPGADGGPPRMDAGPPRTDAGPPRTDAGPPPTDAGFCYPGSILLLVDTSGSMGDPPPSGSGTKFAALANAVNTVLSTLPDSAQVGLQLFPGPTGSCTVAIAPPQVPIGPLSSTRTAILSRLLTTTPTGDTPLWAAIVAAHTALAGARAPSALIVLSDGSDTCTSGTDSATALARVSSAATAGIRTWVVGLDADNNDLSRLAVSGGTSIGGGCLPLCSANLCRTSADCGGGTVCTMSMFGITQCECSVTMACPAPLTCSGGVPPFIPSSCSGDANCCHRNVTGASFETGIEVAVRTAFTGTLRACP